MTNTKVKNGSLLLAEPFMLDDFFSRSVVFLTEHRKDGSQGFILNMQMHISMHDIVEDFPSEDYPIYIGGPVLQQNLFILHNAGDLIAESDQILPGVWYGGNFDNIKALIREELLSPKDIRFFLGYSGWSEGQLFDELLSQSWIVGDFDVNYLFNYPSHTIWPKAMSHCEGFLPVLATMSDNKEVINN
jgi:putative transcriptional regulator